MRSMENFLIIRKHMRSQEGCQSVRREGEKGELSTVERGSTRGNFSSLDDLRDQILAFIAYYNGTMAKPIKWTYTGLT
jgi:hypothetical protein